MNDLSQRSSLRPYRHGMPEAEQEPAEAASASEATLEPPDPGAKPELADEIGDEARASGALTALEHKVDNISSPADVIVRQQYFSAAFD
eukprot:SAG11_NODE_5315_length_1599_cov_0.970000_4_plen_89_part_00